MTVLRPLAQRGFRGASGRCEFVPDACYLEVHLGRVLNVLYWKVAWSTSSSHILAGAQPWLFKKGDSTLFTSRYKKKAIEAYWEECKVKKGGPNLLTIRWMIGDGPGDKNHMESS